MKSNFFFNHTVCWCFNPVEINVDVRLTFQMCWKKIHIFNWKYSIFFEQKKWWWKIRCWRSYHQGRVVGLRASQCTCVCVSEGEKGWEGERDKVGRRPFKWCRHKFSSCSVPFWEAEVFISRKWTALPRRPQMLQRFLWLSLCVFLSFRVCVCVCVAASVSQLSVQTPVSHRLKV